MIPRPCSSYVMWRCLTLPFGSYTHPNPTMNTLKQPLLSLAILIMLVSSAFVPSTYAQTLTITNGLQLWLNADVGVTTNGSGQVTAWADQSVLGNNASQGTLASAPTIAPVTLNGHATLRLS